MAGRQRGDLISLIGEKRIPAEDKHTGSELIKSPESCFDFTYGARPQDVQLQPKGACGILQVVRLGLGTRIRRVNQQKHCSRRGHQFVQQFDPFRDRFSREERNTCCHPAG